MVDDHIGYHTRPPLAESGNHTAQLSLGAEGALLVEVIDWRIAHHITVCIAPSTLRHPDKLEIRGNLVGLGLQLTPRGLRKGIPIEPLQHYPIEIGRPSLCQGAKLREHQQ